MALLTGAIGSIGPKLLELLKGEYELQKGLRDQVQFISDELESVHGALRMVAEVPWDQLDEQVKIWALEVREASYDMEDILDTFLVRVEGHGPLEKGRLKRALKKIAGLFSKGKARHDIAGAINDTEKQLQEMAERRARYKVDDIVAKPAAASSIDPRLGAMYNKVSQLIGIDKSSDKLSSMLSQEGTNSNGKTKIVSIVGVGGLGKTTLAKAVYDELNPHFDCRAFVPVGRNPDLKKVLRDILIDLDKEEYRKVKYNILDERQLINKLRDFLRYKRYFIVIDDVWETKSWEKIQLALVENDRGSRVIKTTRNSEVATSDVYKLQPLSYKDSKMLLDTRIFGSEGKCPTNHTDEASEKILQKCGGIPLAIITMASFLVGKSREDWFDVCEAPGFYRGKDSKQVDDTIWILSLSYYDLPSELKTCLLYLSVYPEDYVIQKDSLIWKWIAEGFIKKKTGTSLFQHGEEYFNQLINRSMIQAVESEGIIYGFRVHDMVLDLIRDLSYELNFVTISNDDEGTTSLEKKVRRLAHQNRRAKQSQQDNRTGETVRSLAACRCDIDSWVPHQSFKLLRVLAIDGCIRVPPTGLHLGNLPHLRYFGMRDTIGIHILPEEIGKLKFLQILDLEDTDIRELPCSLGMLKQMVCMRARGIRTPIGIIGTLTSLQELQIDPRDNGSMRQFVKDLGNLRELRMLRTSTLGMDESMLADFWKSLGSLHVIQHLIIQGSYDSHINYEAWDGAVLPRCLRHLFFKEIWFPRLPSCINPSCLPSLSNLDILVGTMDEQAIKILGGFPELRYLRLQTRSTSISILTANNVAADGCFQKLRSLVLLLSMVHFVANEDSTVSFTILNGFNEVDLLCTKKKGDCTAAPDVMPSLQELQFKVRVKQLIENNGSCENLGLEYLPSLQNVRVDFECWGAFADEVDTEEAALRHAIESHPNRPTLQIQFSEKSSMKSRSGGAGHIAIDEGE